MRDQQTGIYKTTDKPWARVPYLELRASTLIRKLCGVSDLDINNDQNPHSFKLLSTGIQMGGGPEVALDNAIESITEATLNGIINTRAGKPVQEHVVVIPGYPSAPLGRTSATYMHHQSEVGFVAPAKIHSRLLQEQVYELQLSLSQTILQLEGVSIGASVSTEVAKQLAKEHWVEKFAGAFLFRYNATVSPVPTTSQWETLSGVRTIIAGMVKAEKDIQGDPYFDELLKMEKAYWPEAQRVLLPRGIYPSQELTQKVMQALHPLLDIHSMYRSFGKGLEKVEGFECINYRGDADQMYPRRLHAQDAVRTGRGIIGAEISISASHHVPHIHSHELANKLEEVFGQ